MSGQVPLPPGGLADVGGLFIATMIGTIFTHDPFFSITVMALMHYLVILAAHMMPLMSPLANGEFNIRMLIFAIYGALAGMSLLWALNSPVLFPTHSTDGHNAAERRFLPSAFILALSIAFGIQSILIATGFYWRFFPYLQELAPSVHVTVAVILGISLLILMIVIFSFTALGTRWVLTLHYYGRINEKGTRDGKMILWWLLLLVILLGAQGIGDFASSPNGVLPVWAGMLIVAAVNILTWLAAYYFFRNVLGVEEYEFSPKRSDTPWLNFVLIVGGVQVLFTLVYAVFISFIPTFGKLDYTIFGLLVLIWIFAFAYGFWPIPQMIQRRQEAEEQLIQQIRSRSRRRRQHV